MAAPKYNQPIKAKNDEDKSIAIKYIDTLKEKLKSPEVAKKAALIIEELLKESSNKDK